MVASLLFCPTAAAEAAIANDAACIPDPYLYQAILERADQNGDGLLSRQEAKGVQNLEIIGKPIQPLWGIEFCRSLTNLTITGSEMQELDSLVGLQSLRNVHIAYGPFPLKAARPLKAF